MPACGVVGCEDHNDCSSCIHVELRLRDAPCRACIEGEFCAYEEEVIRMPCGVRNCQTHQCSEEMNNGLPACIHWHPERDDVPPICDQCGTVCQYEPVVSTRTALPDMPAPRRRRPRAPDTQIVEPMVETALAIALII